MTEYWIITSPYSNTRGYETNVYDMSPVDYMIKFNRVILFALQISKEEFDKLISAFKKIE